MGRGWRAADPSAEVLAAPVAPRRGTARIDSGKEFLCVPEHKGLAEAVGRQREVAPFRTAAGVECLVPEPEPEYIYWQVERLLMVGRRAMLFWAPCCSWVVGVVSQRAADSVGVARKRLQ